MNQFEYRELQDGGDVGTASPTASPSTLPPAAPDTGYGWFMLVLVCIVAIFFIWRLVVRWRRRREQRLLDIRSAQANRVLGDMQMVPNTDLDDNELL